ncbi:DUF1697 domain-containing protein [Culicoidibacter larvae]|uniref:DUF1697 domain-containing protein n=1 Tax=Culicoidibacter larvae TaxID=2579976 RepID=A0A5R8QB78_9FIRM|nr:DUF1697 domain-containing protein [Culicoidibacter larvae]TLG73798.1 DUF1697 domain-containing protein [Culicoidibacter larvae]
MTYIAFLRGINVGSHNRVRMADLIAICEAIGFTDVKTYIQSGNIIFRSEKDKTVLEKELEAALQTQLSITSSVVIRSLEALITTVDNNPYSKAPLANQAVYFLQQPSNNHDWQLNSDDQAVMIGDCIYLQVNNGLHKTPYSINYFERKLQVAMTNRNIKTIKALIELAQTK